MSHYKAIKNKLDNIIIKGDTKEVLTKVVFVVNLIVVHATQFLKVYLLDYYEKNHGCLPEISKLLVMNCFQVVRQTKPNGNTKNPDDLAKLRNVYDDIYKQTVPAGDIENMQHQNLRQILDYAAVGIVTQYETNIKQNYVDYVERFINVLYDKKVKEKDMSKEQKVEFNKMLRRTKHAILERQTASIPNEIKEHFKHIIIQRAFVKDNLYYDLACHPQDYLSSMIYMNKVIENKGLKFANVFPTRTEIMPKYVTIDTTSLISLFVNKGHYASLGIQNKQDLGNNVNLYADATWKIFFKTNLSCFSKTGYTFNYMIETDGVGCSVLLVRTDLSNKIFKPRVPKAPREQYLDDLSAEEKERLQQKKIVAIDPGKSDLIYCVSMTADTTTTFRYTQQQRKSESKTKKYKHIQETLKNENHVQETQAELSAHNHKTLDLLKYVEYLKVKNRINSQLSTFYQQEVFRKMKWHAYINTSRSESNMINKFKEKFGRPDEVVISIGDWEQRHQMKYKEPSKGVGMRKLFKKHGYKDIYLANEFRSSKKCFHCKSEEEDQGVCEKFMYMPNPRPCKERKECGCNSRNQQHSKHSKIENHSESLVHGLIRCKTCNRTWNRDVNGSLNIFHLSQAAILSQQRPKYLSRPPKRDVDDVDNPVLPIAKKQKIIQHK